MRTHRQSIASGEGVVAVGDRDSFKRRPTQGIQLDHCEMTSLPEPRRREVPDKRIATPEQVTRTSRTRLTEEARTACSTKSVGGVAARHVDAPSPNAAMRRFSSCARCGPTSACDDLAIRQLAGALQNRELALYRRLLIRFALELGTQEDDLDERAKRHVGVIAVHNTGQPPPEKYNWKFLLDPKIPTDPGLFTPYTVYRGITPQLIDLKMIFQPASQNRNFLKYLRHFFEDLTGKGLLAPGDILSKGSMSLATRHLHRSDFGDGVQQDSENLCHMFVQLDDYYSKLPPFPQNPTLHSRNQMPVGGKILVILTMKGKKTCNSPSYFLNLPASDKDAVVDTEDRREAIWP